MPFADAIPDKLTDKMVQRHEAYLDALATHNIACADPSKTSEERAQLALMAVHLWRDFAEACGVPMPSARPHDERYRPQLFDKLADAAATAHAALYAIEAGGLLDALPTDERDANHHNAACRLISLAESRLRMAITEAENV